MKRMSRTEEMILDLASLSEIFSELNYLQIKNLCEQNSIIEGLCESKELADLMDYKYQEYRREKEDKSFPRYQLFLNLSKFYPELTKLEKKMIIASVVHYATDAVDVVKELSTANQNIVNSGMVERAFEDTLVYDGYALRNPRMDLVLERFFYRHGIEEITEDAYEGFQMYLNGYIENNIETM